eukprot:TRINITY_DN66981_c0_g1_i1.p1 TRINITY_DN66981_c0_g1~~TRINITY_DN66981_c0_g1_i1.p1  ORF type:complete len:575 (-),score=42.43 TRINITY_DN66981_c0_g1_i1:19-1584(-)
MLLSCPAFGDDQAACNWYGRSRDSTEIPVQADPQQPFLGVGLQIRYLEADSNQKAFDIVVVRGTLKKGDHLLNTTHNKCSLYVHQLFRASDTCAISQGLPGDVVRVLAPATFTQGCALCTWSDFADAVHLPFLSSLEMERLVGYCYSKRIILDGSKADNDRAIESMQRAVEVDQGLRLEWMPAGDIVLTASGPNHFGSWCNVFRNEGIRLRFQDYHADQYYTLATAVTTRVIVSSRDHACSIVVRLEPSARGEGIQLAVQSEEISKRCGTSGLDAFLRGIRDTCLRGLSISKDGKDVSMLRRGNQQAPGRDVRGRENSICRVSDILVTVVALSCVKTCQETPLLKDASLRDAGASCIRQALSNTADHEPSDATCTALLSESPLQLLLPMVSLKICVHSLLSKRILRHLRQTSQVQILNVCKDRQPLLHISANLPCASLRECIDSVASLSRQTATFESKIRHIEVPQKCPKKHNCLRRLLKPSVRSATKVNIHASQSRHCMPCCPESYPGWTRMFPSQKLTS